MGHLYRTPLAVRWKQPFIDWVGSLDGPGPDSAEIARREIQVYLVHVPEHVPALDALVGEYWPDIFEEELYGWMTDEATWPAPRTRAMFDAWFDVELGDSVIDLVPEEPLTDEDLDAVEVEAALVTCGWCGAPLEADEGRRVGFEIDGVERLAHRAGKTLSLVVNGEQVVTGIVALAESDAAQAGDDLVVKVCSRDCERATRSAVPKALKKALKSLPKPDTH